jgi:hypothetical protein
MEFTVKAAKKVDPSPGTRTLKVETKRPTSRWACGLLYQEQAGLWPMGIDDNALYQLISGGDGSAI